MLRGVATLRIVTYLSSSTIEMIKSMLSIIIKLIFLSLLKKKKSFIYNYFLCVVEHNKHIIRAIFVAK